ncbi:universal stress protein [Natronolimnohabitans innermongolicus]|uniref:UspA domain-containing protein n=1 Tax=Natronolimnohabitans innermongolicus JCM 12255 TaxID=1227499 RepID=L9WJN8_9EURY|nr:universal stress protein [Natronolimnohabitans innermongolicus]ELY48558.1 UspA domain-containing protein [Natronolimnohabitans innermongolicus JCM 12255]
MSPRILVPFDGSPLSRQALETALTEYPDGDIVALHVTDPFEPGYSVYDVPYDIESEPIHGSEEWHDRADELATELLEEAQSVAAEHDAELTLETAVGEPGREIVGYATDNDVDQIIMGSHSREEDARILLGSVTESVVFRAPMRVSLVR